MVAYIGARVDVSLDDQTTVTGKLLSFDRQCNLILQDAERKRMTRGKKPMELRQSFEILMVRGLCVKKVSYTPGVTTSPVVIGSREDPTFVLERRAALLL
jgi:small nuclear ribonucleoprotein (snRNP)-like protein